MLALQDVQSVSLDTLIMICLPDWKPQLCIKSHLFSLLSIFCKRQENDLIMFQKYCKHLRNNECMKAKAINPLHYRASFLAKSTNVLDMFIVI